jgi:hypothetical protein
MKTAVKLSFQEDTSTITQVSISKNVGSNATTQGVMSHTRANSGFRFILINMKEKETLSVQYKHAEGLFQRRET